MAVEAAHLERAAAAGTGRADPHVLRHDAGLPRPARGVLSAAARGAPVVIDNGSWRMRAGGAGESAPPLALRSLLYKPKARGDGLLAQQGFRAGDTVRVVGDYDPHLASLPSQAEGALGADFTRANCRSPFEGGCVVNAEVLETVMDTAMYGIGYGGDSDQATADAPMCVSQCIGQPAPLTAITAELCFERYGATTFVPWHDAAMAFRHARKGQPADGIAVMLGHSTSHVLPILGGKPVYAAAVRVDIAGLRMSEYLLNVLCLRNPQHAPALRWGLPLRRAEECKHALCCTCPDIDHAAFLERIANLAIDDEAAAHEARAKHTRHLQLPWEDAVAQYELALAHYEERKAAEERLKERRREAGQRMRELAAAKRAEKERKLRIEAARLASYLSRVEETEQTFAEERADAEKLAAEQAAAEAEAAKAAAAAERKAARERAKAAKAEAASAAAAAAAGGGGDGVAAGGDAPPADPTGADAATAAPAAKRRRASKKAKAGEDDAPVIPAVVAAVDARRDASLAELMADISAEEASQRIAAGDAAGVTADADGGIFPTAHHLRRRIAEVENDVRKVNNRTDFLPLPPLPPKVYPLVDVPDEALDANGLKEKRKQRLLKASEEYRRKLEEKKKRKREKEEAKIAKMDAEFSEDPEKHLASLHERRQVLLESQRKRLGSRSGGAGGGGSGAATGDGLRTASGRSRRGTGEDRERMRLVAQAAFDPDSGRGGRSGGGKDKKQARKREAAFGAKDSDWDVYAKMDRSNDGGAEEEDETAAAEAVELAFLEERLKALDGGFAGGGGAGVAAPPDPLGDPPVRPIAEHYQVPLLTERYAVGELLFAPSLCGEHASGGLQDALLSSLRRLPGGADGAAAARVCAGGIELLGGTSLLPGVGERLRAEAVARSVPGRAPAVAGPANPDDSLLGAWRGMARFTRDCAGKWEAGAGAAWLTRAEYDEHGGERAAALLLPKRFSGGAP